MNNIIQAIKTLNATDSTDQDEIMLALVLQEAVAHFEAGNIFEFCGVEPAQTGTASKIKSAMH